MSNNKSKDVRVEPLKARANLNGGRDEVAKLNTPAWACSNCHLGDECRCKVGDSKGCWNEKVRT